jgi:hypothetical protein
MENVPTDRLWHLKEQVHLPNRVKTAVVNCEKHAEIGERQQRHPTRGNTIQPHLKGGFAMFCFIAAFCGKAGNRSNGKFSWR